jgi:plastocyanin
MKHFVVILTALALASPLLGGNIHGKVTARGAHNSADAVVYVDRIAGKTFPAPAAHAKMDQKNMQFAPHVLAILEGTTVDFVNSDALLHNVFSPDACADRMNLGTWPQGQTRSFIFKKECFAALLCKVHPEMEGFVAALPTLYFAVTAADGSYDIKDVPDGTYTVKVWHPTLKATQKSVKVAGATEADFEIAK